MSTPTIPKKLYDHLGREIDFPEWQFPSNLFTLPDNPDDTTSDEYFDIDNNPHVVAGRAFSDVSQLFVSARGIDDPKTGAYFPPQLMFTTPELENQNILDLAAWQFDEEFEGGFGEIIRSTDNPCKSYGHQPIELEWYIRDKQPFKGKAFCKMAWARDPHKYKYDIDGKGGIYLDTMYGMTPKKMNPTQFISYAYNPLFNNPYGQSINRPLKPWVETFNKVWGYWRHALEKAGLGSWVGSAPAAWFENNATAAKKLEVSKTAIKAIASGSWSIFPEGMAVENKKLQLEAQAFLDWYTSFCEIVSLIYTGTTGALKEEEYGSRSAKESTDVREKSQREKFNAARVSNFWTWKFIPILVNLNFAPSQIKSYPTLQLISPNLQTPTTPKDQDTSDEIQDDAEGQEREKIEVKTKETKGVKPDKEQELMAPPWYTPKSKGYATTEDVTRRMKKFYASYPEYKPEGNHTSSTVELKNAETLEERCNSHHQKTGVRCTLKKGHMSFHLGTNDSQWTDFEPLELQEEEEEPTPPVAIPPTYEGFPDAEPEPEIFAEFADDAKKLLNTDVQVKPYKELERGEGEGIFTIKRFRSFDPVKQTKILNALKAAIAPTLDAPTEAEAWTEYYNDAVEILKQNGLNMSPELRDNLITSFRQTRQYIRNKAIKNKAKTDSSIVGFRIKAVMDTRTRYISKLWADVALATDDPLWDVVTPPSDFGDRGWLEPVYKADDLTPKEDIPSQLPGRTYRYYAQPTPEEEGEE